MDIAKAFDKVPHQHLLYKLYLFGINGNALHWISDFLIDRTWTVVMEGEMLDKVPVASGVNQGTVLEPILFLIFINEFTDYIQHSTFQLIADDSITYNEFNIITHARHLQSDLVAACRCGLCIHLHHDKCSVLTVSRTH